MEKFRSTSAAAYYLPPLTKIDSAPSIEAKNIEDLFKKITEIKNPESESIHSDSVITCLVLTKDEKKLISGTMTGEILVWELGAPAPSLIQKNNYTSPIKALVVNQSSVVYAGAENGKLLKWDLKTDTKEVFRDMKISINALALLNDSSIALGSNLFDLEIWTDTTKPLIGYGHEGEINCIKINKAGKIFTGSSDQSIRVWDFGDNSVDEVRKNEDLHKSAVTCMEILENFLVTGDYGGTLIVWNIDELECQKRISVNSPVEQMCKSEDGQYLFVLPDDTENRKILVFGTGKIFEEEKPFRIKNAHKAAIKSIVYQSKTGKLISASEDKNLKIWSLSKASNEKIYYRSKNLTSFTVSEGGFVYSKNGKIKFLSLKNREKQKKIEVSVKISNIVIGHNQNFMIHDSGENVLYVWRPLVFLEPIAKFLHPDQITSFDFLDKNYVITGCNDQFIRIWSLVFEKLDQMFDHSSPVSSVKFTLKYFYVASPEGIITIYRRRNLKIKKKIEYKSQIYSIDCNQENLLVAGGQSGVLKCWKWKEMRFKVRPTELAGHKGPITRVVLKKNLVFTSGFDRTLRIWSASLGMLYYSFELSLSFTDFQISPDESEIFFLTIKGIFSTNSPLKSEETEVYPQQYSWVFLSYIKKLFQNKTKIFDPRWTNYLIFPHTINLLYIFIKANHPALLKLALTQGVKFVQDRNKESPLSLALTWKNYKCADVILKTFAKMKLKKEFGILECVEMCMNEIISSNLSKLPKFFDSLFPVKTNRLAVYASLLRKAPMIIEKKSSKLQEAEFINYAAEAKEQVQFKASILKFDFEEGSNGSMKLLRAIRSSSNADLFRTALLKSILKYKWGKVYYVLLVEAVLFFVLIILQSFLSVNSLRDVYLIIFLIIINFLMMVREAIQAAENLRKYFKDFWNFIDLTRIFGTYIFAVFLLFEKENLFLNQILAALYWAKAVTYFRIFDKTRYLIRMIVETFTDIIPFLLIFFSSTFTFALLFYIVTKSSDFSTSFVHTYQLNFNDFSGIMPKGFRNDYTSLFWVVFYLSSVLNPIILLNMLIAIMSDTYDRVQEDQVVADCKEMAGLIMQAEGVLFWKRLMSKKGYIQRCDYVRHLRTETNEWMGKIRAIKKSISRVQVKVKANDKKLEIMQGRIGVKIREIKTINEQIAKKINQLEGQESSIRSANSFISSID